LEDVPEVVVSVDGSGGIECNVSEQLHSDDCIDEEKHHHEHHHIWKSLRRERFQYSASGECFATFIDWTKV
jgi:hypothetical protein